MNALTPEAPRHPHRPADSPPGPGATTGAVTVWLRAEGAAALVVAALAYRATGASWWLFAGLFLVPDISMLGYLANRRLGAALYNLGHSYLSPAALALFGWWQDTPGLYGPALIWVAHIGFDRMLGYGLKYGAAFGATHLGWRGKIRSEASA